VGREIKIIMCPSNDQYDDTHTILCLLIDMEVDTCNTEKSFNQSKYDIDGNSDSNLLPMDGFNPNDLRGRDFLQIKTISNIKYPLLKPFKITKAI
jgi:hypothetical protein